MSARAVVASTGDEQDDNQQGYEQGNDPENLHPARRAGGGFTIRSGSHDRQLYRDSVSLSSHSVTSPSARNTGGVPKLWNDTIETHRAAVREATLNATAALVSKHGLRSVTMSQIAAETGIGRATLYKYFPDVEAILLGWHEREITGHLELLAEVRDRAGDAGQRLEAVLQAYAVLSHQSRGHHDTDLEALLHRDRQVPRAQRQVHDMIRDLLTEGAQTGDFRDDVAPDELASYCLHALAAASALRSQAAIGRLVTVTLAGLRPPL